VEQQRAQRKAHRLERAARRRFARWQATKEDSLRAFQKLITVYREGFEARERDKLPRCLALCAAVGQSVPSWAEAARARAIEEWRLALVAPRGPRSKPPTFDQFLIGERRGRHSEADRLRKLVIVEGVELAKDYGIRGERIFEFAASCLYEYRKTFGNISYSKADAVKAIYYRPTASGKVPHDVGVRMQLTKLMAPKLHLFPAGGASSS